MNYDKKNNDHRYGITRYNKKLIRKYKRLFIWSFIGCLLLAVWVVQLKYDLKWIEIENDLLKISQQTDNRDFIGMEFTIDSLLFLKMLNGLNISFKPDTSFRVIPIDTITPVESDTFDVQIIDTIQKTDTITINDTIE